jgi:hypothetical protein
MLRLGGLRVVMAKQMLSWCRHGIHIFGFSRGYGMENGVWCLRSSVGAVDYTSWE